MKSLKEYSYNILSGKMLMEKLVVGKTNKSTGTYIQLPRADFDNDRVICDEEWRTISIPEGEYFIYKDMYRGKRPHLATKSDMIFNIIYNQQDYEDFNEAKDILYASDNLKDIVGWYFTNVMKVKKPKPNEEYEDWAEQIYANRNVVSICDNYEMLYEFYMGNDSYEEWFSFKDYNDMEQIANDFADTVAWNVINKNDK